MIPAGDSSAMVSGETIGERMAAKRVRICPTMVGARSGPPYGVLRAWLSGRWPRW